jgi:hypothetical protein
MFDEFSYWQSEEYRLALHELSHREAQKAEKTDATKMTLSEALSKAR